MSALWPRLESHLVGVDKPARHIGLELGAQTPGRRPDTVSRRLTCPDTYNAGLPKRTALPVTCVRKGPTVVDDARPAIFGAHIAGATQRGTSIGTELATGTRAPRPGEFVAAIDPEWHSAKVTRINQWTQDGGARREVNHLSSAATPSPPHAEVRAS